MPRLDRRSFRHALLLGAAVLATTLSCGREVTGPPDGMRIVRGFTFEVRFGPSDLPNGVASDLVAYTRVRVVLVNASGATVVDRVVDFPSDVQEVPLALDVPLSSGTTSAGETMSLSLAYINAAGDTVFRGGPQPVTVVAGTPGSPPPPAPVIAVTYTGTGATASQVVISPASDTVVSGDAFAYTAAALDGQGSPLAGTPIAWRSVTPTRATITAPGAGTGTTLPSRGPALIIAQLLTGQADTAALEVLPRAQALALVSGNNQTATFNSLLSQPLVVRVSATDGLPMAGVPVNFSVATGGGSVSAPMRLTDANGLAQVTWTTGNGLGAQTVTATAAGLAGSPLTFTSVTPITELLHHYPMTGDVNDVVGGQDGTLVGGAVVTNGALTLDGTTGYVQLPAHLIPTTGSYSVSLFVRNRTAVSNAAAFVSQGTFGDAFFVGNGAAGTLRAGDDWLNTGVANASIDGLYRHFVVTVDAAANTSRLYVNGALQASLPQAIASSALGSGTRLGRQHTDGLEYLDGDIDEVRIYRGALTADAVAALAATGTTTVDRLAFGTQPTNVVAGAVIAPPVVVRVEDALGRLRTGFNGVVAINLNINPGFGSLGGTLEVNAVGGIATFADLTLSSAANGYRLIAAIEGSVAAVSAFFNVLPAAAATLEFTQPPTNALPATALAPAITVTARDAFGNVAAGFTGAVTLAFGTNPTSAVLGGTATVNAVAGVATFNDITVDRAGVGFTLTAAATGLTGTTSGAFSILSGAATRLDVTQQPTTAIAGVPFTPALVVTALDGGGNVATGFTGEVTVAVWNGNGAIGGTVAVTAVAGVATFSNVWATATNTGLRLRATATGLTPDTTVDFSVAPGTPYELRFDQQPSTVQAGQPITPAVTVYAVDPFGNTTPAFAGTVTVAIGNNAGGATLGGTLTVNPLGGIATFSDLTLSAPGSGYTLTAGAPAMVSGTSAAFNVTASVFANSWTNAAGGTWSTAGNWSLGRAPIATDTVLINLDGTYTVTMDVNHTGSNVFVGGGLGTQTLAVGVRTLSVSEALSVLPSGALTISGAGAIAGAGVFVNQGVITTVGGAVNLDFSNQGTFVAQGTTNISGTVANGPVAMLRVLGSSAGSNATLTASAGVFNEGTVELTTQNAGYAVSFAVTGAEFINAASGTIATAAGAGGSRLLAAELANLGTVNVPYSLTLSQADAAHQNSGTINLIGGDLVVTQTGTSPSFTNAGSVALGTGRTFTVSNGVLDLSTGIVSGAGGYLVTTGAPTVLFSTATVRSRVSLSAATVLPTPFTVPAGDSLRILNGTFAPPSLQNDGLLILEGAPTITTAFTMASTSTLRLRGNAVGSNATPTFTNAFTNDGALELTTENAGYAVQLNVPTGTLVNGPTGTISALTGAGGARILNAQFDNQGTVNAPATLTIDRPEAAHLNSGTINVTTGNLQITQTGTAPSFINTGTVALTAGRTMTVAGGLLDLSAGQVTGYNGYLVTTGAPTVLFSTATVQPRVTFSAATVLPNAFTVPAGDSLRVLNGRFAPPSLQNDGLLILEGAPTITTAFTMSSTSTLRLRGSSVGNNAIPTFSNAFSNVGLLELTTENAGYQVELVVPTGTLLNTATGTISALTGAGGARILNAQLDNQGTINAPATLTIARPDAAHVNGGTINVTTGNLQITQSGTAPSFTNTGVVALTAGRTMTVSGGLLDLSVGQVTGFNGYLVTTGAATVLFSTATVQPRVTFSATTVLPNAFTVPAGDSLRVLGGRFAPPSLQNDGLLILEGAPTITTAFTMAPTSTLRLRGDAVGNNAIPTFTNAFANVGLLELTTENAGYQVELIVPTGTLLNTSTGTISALGGAGGARIINAQFDNQGTVNAPATLTIDRPDAVQRNSGTINLTTGNLQITQSGTAPGFINTGTVALTAGRTMTVAGGLLDLSAGQVTGYNGYLVTTGAPTVLFSTATVQPRVTFSATTVLPNAFTVPAGDSLRVLGGRFAPPSLQNDGLLILEGAPTITTAFTMSSTSTMRLRGSSVGNNAIPTFSNAFSNVGLLELTTENAGYQVELIVPTGTLVNTATGTISALSGAGGARIINAQFDNQGTVNAPATLTISRPEAAHLNSGIINVTTGNLQITQSGTAPSFTNAGTIAMTAGRTMTVAGGLLDLSAGQVTGYGSYLTTTGAVTLLFTTATAQPRMTLSATTVLPNAFTVPAGDSLRVLGGRFAPPSLQNDGVLILEGAPTITTAYTMSQSSTLRLRGSAVGNNAAPTFTNAFTNVGLIELVTENAGYAVELIVPSGTLLNASTGTISALAGAGGARIVNAQLDNQGTVNAPATLTLDRPGAAHVNSGTFNVTTGNLTITQSGTTPSFTNTGTIALTAGRTMTVAGGSLDLMGGIVSGPGGYLVTTGSPSVLLSPATVQPRLTFSATTAVPVAITIAPGDSLRLLNGTFAPVSLVNDGLLALEGTATINTALTSNAGASIVVRGNAQGGNANATFVSGFTNAGTLALTSENAGYPSGMNVGSGTLVNAATGTIDIQPGAGGARAITAPLIDNSGSFSVNATATLSGAFDQRQALTVAAARTLTIGGMLSLYTGSTTTVLGALVKNGGCTNLGGSIGGGGTGATCP